MKCSEDLIFCCILVKEDKLDPPEEGYLSDATKGPDHLRDVFGHMGLDDKEIVALSGVLIAEKNYVLIMVLIAWHSAGTYDVKMKAFRNDVTRGQACPRC